MSDAFLLHREGGVLTITFNRPERLNAFRRREYGRLHELLGEIERDDMVRVVVFTGAGRGFCAGEDLKELQAQGGEETAAAGVRAGAEVLQDITRRMVQSERVFVAAVNGVAAGFGAELSIACDLRLAGPGARFLFPEVRRGLFITNGVSLLLPRIVGTTWASTLLLTGEAIDALQAERIGLVTEVVEGGGEGLVARAQACATAIAANAPTAVRLTKRILRAALDGSLETILSTELDYLERCLSSGEHLEGARAFVEKRAPRFNA